MGGLLMNVLPPLRKFSSNNFGPRRKKPEYLTSKRGDCKKEYTRNYGETELLLVDF